MKKQLTHCNLIHLGLIHLIVVSVESFLAQAADCTDGQSVPTFVERHVSEDLVDEVHGRDYH